MSTNIKNVIKIYAAIWNEIAVVHLYKFVKTRKSSLSSYLMNVVSSLDYIFKQADKQIDNRQVDYQKQKTHTCFCGSFPLTCWSTPPPSPSPISSLPPPLPPPPPPFSSSLSSSPSHRIITRLVTFSTW